MSSTFEALLKAANEQVQPQRLLMVFTHTELPDNHSALEAKRFADGEGGALTPVMCIDKAPGDLTTFSALVDEAKETGQDWAVVMVACLSGKNGNPASYNDIDSGLKNMVSAIQNGMVANFMSFDKQGELLEFF